jgi:hypothetical protein
MILLLSMPGGIELVIFFVVGILLLGSIFGFIKLKGRR